jgi:hypothetical protein
MNAERVRIQTLHWIETIVIGLDLCPFARRSIDAARLRVEVSDVSSEGELANLFVAELRHLESTAGANLDSTLIVHPLVFQDFIDFNDFLGVAEALLEAEGFQEKFQIASFHPDYRFEGADPDAIGNFTNRSPHPMLHLLRESSVSRAVDAHPDPESIPTVNISRLEALGMPALRRLLDS